MRCPEVVLSAMVSHPGYRDMPGLKARAFTVFAKFPHWALARYLPVAAAKELLTTCLPEIRQTQSKSGLWKKKFGEERACGILLALKYAGIIGTPLKAGVLPYDPYVPFAHVESLHGFLVRRLVMEAPLATDETLREVLIRQIVSEQTDDGSWTGTVAATACRLEQILAAHQTLSSCRKARPACLNNLRNACRDTGATSLWWKRQACLRQSNDLPNAAASRPSCRKRIAAARASTACHLSRPRWPFARSYGLGARMTRASTQAAAACWR